MNMKPSHEMLKSGPTRALRRLSMRQKDLGLDARKLWVSRSLSPSVVKNRSTGVWIRPGKTSQQLNLCESRYVSNVLDFGFWIL